MKNIGIGILIDSSSRILLLKRSNYTKMYPHYWDIPGGRGREGEAAEDVVIREIKEETSFDLTPTKLYHTEEMEHNGEIYLVHMFLGTYTGKIGIQEEEADGYAWYTFEETQKLDIAFNRFENIKQLHKDGLIK